jgi:hypothetical protein
MRTFDPSVSLFVRGDDLFASYQASYLEGEPRNGYDPDTKRLTDELVSVLGGPVQAGIEEETPEGADAGEWLSWPLAVVGMKLIRRAFPSLRRTHPWAIVHSGGRATVFGCLCGSTHTTSTDWGGRTRLHVLEWQEEHDDCADELAALVAEGRARLYSRIGYVGHVLISMPVIQEQAPEKSESQDPL